MLLETGIVSSRSKVLLQVGQGGFKTRVIKVLRKKLYLHHGGKLVSVRRNLLQKLDTQQWHTVTALSDSRPQGSHQGRT